MQPDQKNRQENEIEVKELAYTTKDAQMKGYLALPKNIKSPLPAILIGPDWMGIGDRAKRKTEQLAKEGYVALAADIYGNSIKPKNTEEAKKAIAPFKDNRALLKSHMVAAFEKLKSLKEVNPKKIVVIGYCFGGMAALELGRTGADVAGIVSFHGDLSSPHPEEAKNIKAKVLVLHGADDPGVPPNVVDAFKKSMDEAGADYKFISYEGAVHGFTNKEAGTDNSKGIAYNENADKESWAVFEKFIKAIFK